jgi:hypothetical protein
MKSNAYAVYDLKAEVFWPPTLFKNDAEASRVFKHFREDPSSAIHKNPEDYQFYYVGTFDDSTGMLFSDQQRVVVLATLPPAPSNVAEAA